MLNSTEQILNSGLAKHVIRDADLCVLFRGSPARRYGLVNKALKKGELIQIRRGLYTLALQYQSTYFSQNYLANHIVSYSYVTAESALSFHQWIPERIEQVTSIAAFGRNKTLHTPFGDFIYCVPRRINPQNFLKGVQRINIESEHSVWMATPLRALVDYVYWHRTEKANLCFLRESLRIESEQLQTIDHKSVTELMSIYAAKHVTRFLHNLLHEI